MCDGARLGLLRKSLHVLWMAVLGVSLGVASRGRADQVYVEAAEGTGLWSDANAWIPNVVPDNGNDGNTYAVWIERNHSMVADSDVILDELNVDTATLVGANKTIDVLGRVELRSATLSGPGKTNVQGELYLVETNVLDGHTLTNAGYGNYGEFSIGRVIGKNAAVLSNLAGATFEITEGAHFVDGGGAKSVFDNAGRLTHSTAGTTEIGWALNNSGALHVERGLLRLSGGGSNTGEIEVRVGAYLDFVDGEHVLTASARLHGDGIVTFSGATVNLAGDYRVVGTTYIEGGTVNVNSSMGPMMMIMSGGTFGGNGGIAPLGQIVWSGGTFAGKGRVYSPLLLSISRTDAKMIDGWSINSSGKTVWWHGAEVSAQNGAKFNNSGDFEVIGDGYFTYTGVGVEAGFNNSGRFVKSAGTGAMQFDGMRFNNTGLVQVKSGSLVLAGPVTQVAGETLTGGEWEVFNGATLAFAASSGGIATNQAKVTLRGPASVFVPINALADNQGSFAIMDGREFVTAGDLWNSGTLTVGADSSLTVNGVLVNTGIIQAMGAVMSEQSGGASHAAPRRSVTVAGTIINGGAMSFMGGIQAGGGTVVNTGTMGISGPQEWAVDSRMVIEDGGRLVMGTNAGAVAANLGVQVKQQARATFMSRQRLRYLEIADGEVAVVSGGGNTLRAGALRLSGEGRLDLADNGMVVDAEAGSRQAVLKRVEDWVRQGRNGGTWDGAGITSAAARDDVMGMTGLAVVLNEAGEGGDVLVSEFGGEVVGPDSVLLKYTWNGDANTDGIVNADDYFLADSGFITQIGGWYNGDFNYDGVMNADDYFLIDSAFIGQRTGVAFGLVVPVPEPGVLGIVMLGMCRIAARRRARV